MDSDTILDLPEVQEVGSRWLVPRSDAVVYARLVDVIETPMRGDRCYQIWSVEITESILEALEDGEVIRLLHGTGLWLSAAAGGVELGGEGDDGFNAGLGVAGESARIPVSAFGL